MSVRKMVGESTNPCPAAHHVKLESDLKEWIQILP